MTIKDAIRTLDEVIPPPDNKMVDLEHAPIAFAWKEIRTELLERCDTCRTYGTDSYKYYSYPCSECKYRARDSWEAVR